MINFCFKFFLKKIAFCRFFKPWVNLIIQDVSVAVCAMNAWTVFHLLLMWIIKFTVLMIITECLLQSVLVVEKVRIYFLYFEWGFSKCYIFSFYSFLSTSYFLSNFLKFPSQYLFLVRFEISNFQYPEFSKFWFFYIPEFFFKKPEHKKKYISYVFIVFF